MNNYAFPFPTINPNHFMLPPIEEIQQMKERIHQIEERLNQLEKKKEEKYLKKEDNYYMI